MSLGRTGLGPAHACVHTPSTGARALPGARGPEVTAPEAWSRAAGAAGASGNKGRGGAGAAGPGPDWRLGPGGSAGRAMIGRGVSWPLVPGPPLAAETGAQKGGGDPLGSPPSAPGVARRRESRGVRI